MEEVEEGGGRNKQKGEEEGRAFEFVLLCFCPSINF